MRFVSLVALAASVSATALPAQEQLPLEQAQLKAHVAFLASDALRGREAATEDYDVAAEYVASQFMALGLKPGGPAGSYLQPVPLVTSKASEKGSLTLKGPKGETSLLFGEDMTVSPSTATADLRINAPLIFAGFGVVSPQLGYDDFRGLDVRGKIVVLLHGAPKAMPSEERAHHGNVNAKAIDAQARGAIGIITVETPSRNKVRAFSEVAKHWDDRAMQWRTPGGAGFDVAPKAPRLAYVSLKGAEKLFAALPGGASAVMAAAEAQAGKVKGGALGLSAIIRSRAEIERRESSNVVGILEGSDPALKAETVILSGHLDHTGVGKPVKGDSINNGAMDNAVGIGAMIEVARKFVASGERPKRSIMFLAVTAEEKGLVGSDYFARNPTIAKANMVANVNLDMPIITYDFKDIIAFGAERSSIGPIAKEAAMSLGIELSPDPTPDQGLFTRSDHYRFVQQGVPAVFVVTGYKAEGAKANPEFLGNHYHKPSDDMALPINWAAGARFVSLNHAMAKSLANAPARPRWNKGDFFGTMYGGFGAK